MAGFNAYLVKPVDSRAVEKLIAAAILFRGDKGSAA